MQFYRFIAGDAEPFDASAVVDVLVAFDAKRLGNRSYDLREGDQVETQEFEINDDDFEFPVFLNSFTKNGMLTYHSVTTDDAIYVGRRFPELCWRLIGSVHLTGFFPEGDWAPLVSNDCMVKELPKAFPPHVLVRSADDVKRALGLE